MDITLQEARDGLGRLVTRAADTGEAVTITRYGRPEAVLVPAAAYEELRALRRERDRRHLAERRAADERGEIDWVSYPASTRAELEAGLDDALGL